MDDVKRVYRKLTTQVKKTARGVDGTDLRDRVGNAGDDARSGLGNMGDGVRRSGRGADLRPGESKALPDHKG